MGKNIVIKFIGPMKKPEGKSKVEKNFNQDANILGIMKDLSYSEEEISHFSFFANKEQVETSHTPVEGEIIIVSMPLGGG